MQFLSDSKESVHLVIVIYARESALSLCSQESVKLLASLEVHTLRPSSRDLAFVSSNLLLGCLSLVFLGLRIKWLMLLKDPQELRWKRALLPTCTSLQFWVRVQHISQRASQSHHIRVWVRVDSADGQLWKYINENLAYGGAKDATVGSAPKSTA